MSILVFVVYAIISTFVMRALSLRYEIMDITETPLALVCGLFWPVALPGLIGWWLAEHFFGE